MSKFHSSYMLYFNYIISNILLYAHLFMIVINLFYIIILISLYEYYCTCYKYLVYDLW